MSAVTNLENKSYACVLVDLRTRNPYHNCLLEMLTWFPKVSYWGGGRGLGCRFILFFFFNFCYLCTNVINVYCSQP